MKRFLFAAILIINVCFIYAADTLIELTVWNMPSDADKLYKKIWDDGINEFQIRYPKIKINGISREYNPQEFVSVMASGKGPDIVRIPITALPAMAKYGFLAKLNKFTEKWIQKDYMPMIMWDSVNVEGGIYGIPYDSYFTTLFYRKDIFEKCGITKPPEKWSEIIDVSKKINSVMPDVWGIALPADTFYFIDFIWQAGGDIYKDGKINFNNPGVIKALDFWYNIKWQYKIMPPQNLFDDYDIEQLFSSGKIAMMIGVAKRLPVMARRYGLNLKNVEIVPLPAGDTGIKAWHIGGEAFIINSSAPEEKIAAAWEYIKYILSPPYQLWKWMTMKELNMIIFPGDFSCATNLINMPEFSKVKDLLLYGHSEPAFYKWYMVKEDFNKYVLEKLFIDKNIKIEETLFNFQKKIEREYYGR
jgi:ABC-type glycerol-3-phosphate transport system substrate-binding protein